MEWFTEATNWITHLLSADVEELLGSYGYLAILILTFLEGETIVIIAGAFAAKGLMNPYIIALCALCGSFTSDQVMFSLGRYKGQAMLQRFPKIAKNMDKATRLFKKYDTALILGFRFVYGVRNVTPILLGISGVSHLKFFVLNLIGAVVWAIAFTAGGYFFGKVFEHLMESVGTNFFYILAGLLVLGGAFWWYRRKKHQAKAISQNDQTPPTDQGNHTS